MLFLSGYSSVAISQLVSANENCKTELEKILRLYNVKYNKERYAATFSTQVMEGGEQGEKLVTKIWRDGKNIKIENPYLMMFIDTRDHIIILKDSRAIIARSNSYDNAGKLTNIPSVSNMEEQLMENINKYASNIYCEKQGREVKITLSFPESAKAELGLLKKVILHCKNDGTLLKGEYEYYADKGVTGQVYEYLSFTDNIDAVVFAGNAVGQVFEGNKLKEIYQGFEFKDLRKQNK